ncbi:MAG: bifunctional 5,10-methylenetetrahydrofolate dehydrogenase/5,10-methenyltetrahydrofolate cyclohydrolase [Candidatus Marinimicrobia bacterium]|nr:bifunctional 5,10-methylenetetrahydrofolate dehydrogenase/5,10-methenyltetrahydrofolate cyclohydrolase [Candidatus Neomarinimicrobiota bacterium]MBT3675812.1 bifunctional 5,10-methylenetetrahydrofolate dehydrogenase/5,10-methenyltetrahydrofolate cyclohydrolase [Candidatus Neomarinimicrobiota bacterium]MBT3762974.1 bifunctional 5,10-methylenetetrahydrofolate dehydrogenase/5,10-methenyltetrahydrofolate cyclohydrolase [Candidatus Neomarinimicrobiota bacterium]MBT4069121.1 bifunctional 5,10-methy
MDTKILSGKEVSKSVYDSLLDRISVLKSKNITPGLAVILVGEDPASQVYVRNKTRKFHKLGLHSETMQYPADASQNQLISKINELNNDNQYHGILIQLPLPKHIDSDAVLNTVNPKKDVDGFHPYNLGCLAAGKPTFIPCTPKGIMRILEHYKINLSGKHVVVVGRSNIVGRPISILTSLKQHNSNATTTICHSGTQNLIDYTKQADILILALGSPEFLKGDNIKEGAVIIDVGINRVDNDSSKGYKLVGDGEQISLSGKSSALTPVPGGVGPMTIAMLVENTVEAAEQLHH